MLVENCNNIVGSRFAFLFLLISCKIFLLPSANVCHGLDELDTIYGAVSHTVKDFECLGILVLLLGLLDSLGHKGAKLKEVNVTVLVLIDIVHHVTYLFLCVFLTHRLKDVSELFCRDGLVTIFIK